jgi:hypothetical protein
VIWLRSLPWTDEQRERLEQVLWLYCVRHWPKDGRVVFWQIDNEGRPHGAKMMAYHSNGKRWKKEENGELGRPRWVHNQDGFREHLDLDHHQFVASLFGMHLMTRYPQATINIVESEKTAIVMATMYGDLENNLWFACGGLEFLKVEALRPLIDKGRRVWVWPDKDGVEKWKAKVGHLISERFGIYTGFFDKYWIEADGKKADVCDINLRLLCHPETANTKEPEVIETNGKKPEGVTDEEWLEHLKTIEMLTDWVRVTGDAPIIDHIEQIDPYIRKFRQILHDKTYKR